MNSFALLFVLALSVMSPTSADRLPVIHDAGGTRLLAPLYADLLPVQASGVSTHSRQTPTPAANLRAPDPSTALRQYDESRFPVHTPELSAGPVASRPLPESLHESPPPLPFFLVGIDPLSSQWLVTWQSRLRELGAAGLVVEAPDRAAFEALVRVADGLPLAPASGSAIARLLGLTHYPVLISREGIEQ